MEPPVIFFNSIIIIITIMVIFLPVIVKLIARRLGKDKKKEVQRQPAEAAPQLFKDEEALPEERVQPQLTESGEWLPEVKQGARSRINQLPPLQRAVIWSEILKRPDWLKRPGLY
ncbi:MAG: hypothetical protein GH155_01955 [Spirochaeta sp.]|nr:hypothetical protein [Spirochaeta sp.]